MPDGLLPPSAVPRLLRLLRPLLLFVSFVLFVVPSLRAADTKILVCFGDSITAGYGLDDPAADAYPAVLQKKISAAGLAWRVVNAGLSGDTTAGGLRRIDWVLRQPIDLFLIALGGNDGLRGVEPAVTRANLQGIVDRIRAQRPAARIVIAGMQIPPSMGPDYARDFAAVFPEIAAKNSATFLPFLLENVGGRPELNQPDRIHPTPEGQAIVADNVWKILRPLL